MTTGILCVRLAVLAQDGVLLPLPLRIQGAESVTIDLARATVPGSPPAALPLHPPWARSRQKQVFMQRAGGSASLSRELSRIP